MFGRRTKTKVKKKKPFSTKSWHLYGYFDISDRAKMLKEIAKMRKSGFSMRYRRASKSRYRVEAKEAI